MVCVSPPALAERDLLIYLDGEAGHEVVAHLEQCSYCRERAHHLARLQERLTAQLYRFECPSPEELGEYHLDILAHERMAAIAQHLNECLHCAQEIALLKGYLDALKADLEVRPLERMRIWVARLVREMQDISRPPQLRPAHAAVRGEEEGPYLYQAGEIQIVIEVQDDADRRGRRTLLGLVTGGDTHQLEAHLWQGHRHIATAPVDELGNLILSDLLPGNYELIISGPQMEVHIQTLNI